MAKRIFILPLFLFILVSGFLSFALSLQAEECPPGTSTVTSCSRDDQGNECRSNRCERSCEPNGSPRNWQCYGGADYSYESEYGYQYQYQTPPPPTYTLTTSISSGSGTLSATGISCPGDCSQSYNSGTWVTLIATPATGYVFSSWSGACAGQGSSCSVYMNGDKSASATFVAAFNYSLSNSGTSSVTKSSDDEYTQNTITKTLVAGSTESVSLSLSGVPSGVTYAISSSTCSPTCSSVITFTVPSSAPVGTYPIVVTGSPLSKTTSFNLVISANPVTSLTCAADPSPALLGEEVTWTGTITGGTPPFTYEWSGTNIPTNPAPSTNPYTITYNTLGLKTAVLTVTDADDQVSTCTNSGGGSEGGTVFINFNPTYEEF